jgi:hypothetical protein
MHHLTIEYHGSSFSLQALPLFEMLSAQSILGPEQTRSSPAILASLAATNGGLMVFFEPYIIYHL